MNEAYGTASGKAGRGMVGVDGLGPEGEEGFVAGRGSPLLSPKGQGSMG